MAVNRNYSDMHYDRVLTDMSVAYFQNASNFVCSRVFPPVPVRKASDRYREYPRGYFSRSDVDTTIAEEARPNRITYGTKTTPYSTEERALAGFISDKARANVDSEQNLNFEMTQLIVEAMLLGKEKNFSDRFLKPGVWGKDYIGQSDEDLDTAVSVSSVDYDGKFKHWGEKGTAVTSSTSGTPIETIAYLQTVMQRNTLGRRPNCLLVSRDVYDVLRNHYDILDRVRGGANVAMPAQVGRAQIASLLEVEELLIMDTVHNTAADQLVDQDTGEPPASMEFMRENFAYLFHKPASVTPGLYKPLAGVDFVWDAYVPTRTHGAVRAGPAIRRYRESPAILGEYLEGRYQSNFHKVSADCGIFLDKPLST